MAKMFILDNSKIKNGGGLEYKKRQKLFPKLFP
jgi:ribosome-associated protein YbcJ (S4-like RNA binding protein)